MNIVVCVKQVPDTTARKDLTSDYRLKRQGVESVLNPFDEYALEEGIRQQEAHGGEVTILTMGLPSAEETMRKGLAMGAARGVLISDEDLVGSDVWVTAKVLAAALRKLEFDLVLFGQESSDARTGLLPAAVAEHLDLPLFSYAQKLDIENTEVTTQREVPGGYQVVSGQMPAVVMVVKAINEPRYPSLKGIMGAKRKEIVKWSLADLGEADMAALSARTKVSNATARPEKAPGRTITEAPGRAAELIADYLFESKVVA